MAALYRVVPYLTAFRIVREGAPSGAYVEQHADPSIVAARLKALNATTPARRAPVAKPSKASPSKSPAPPVDAPSVGAADLSVLDGSLASLATALGSGACDDRLQALLNAETGGKTRKGAVAMITSRLEEIS